MKSVLKKDIPPRAAIVVVALVLFASIVSGREAPDSGTVAALEARPAAQSAKPQPAAHLDLEKLERSRGKQNTIHDLFAPRRPPAQPVAKPAPKPVAPPLPFRYLGRLVEDDKTTVFLVRGDEHYSAEAGQMVDNLYRVEKIADSAVTLTYLPLGTSQVLPLPGSD